MIKPLGLWGVLLAVMLLAWFATPGAAWPAAYLDAMGWFAGARGAWLLLGPWWVLWAVVLSLRWGSEKALPILMLCVAAMPAVLAWWPAGAQVLSGLANVVWALVLFLVLLPVAFVVSLFG